MTVLKEDNSKSDLEYEKAREKGLKKFNADMEKLSKSDFEDFKTGVIKQLSAAHGSIFMLAESDAEQKLSLIERIHRSMKGGDYNGKN